MIFKKMSKWVPLASYEHSGNVYLIMCRKNTKSGMLYFKTKMINRPLTCCFQQPSLEIDKQFIVIMEA